MERKMPEFEGEVKSRRVTCVMMQLSRMVDWKIPSVRDRIPSRQGAPPPEIQRDSESVSPIKICPSCGHSNLPEEFFCALCMADISGIAVGQMPPRIQPRAKAVEAQSEKKGKKGKPSSSPAQGEPADGSTDSGRTVREQPRKLTCKFGDRMFEIQPDDILGRHAVGQELFGQFQIVSRKHLKITWDAGTWFVEDLESGNGTFVNGRRLAPLSKEAIKPGDVLSLSAQVTIEILEES